MAYLTLRDGARLHYHDIGRGRPCILLHGFGMRAALWLPLVAPLALTHRFILPDLRGFGGSHRLRLNRSCLLSNYADDLDDLITGLQLDGALLGGLSMGACTAMQYQRQYGFGRIGAYLQIDQAPCVQNRRDWRWGLFGERHESRMAYWRELMADFEAEGRERPFAEMPRGLRQRLWHGLSEFIGDAFHQPLLRRASGWVRHEPIGRRVLGTDNWPVYLDCVRAYLDEDYDFRASLARAEVPLTVFVGMNSAMYPARGQLQIAELAQRVETVRFEDCGHALPFEAPRRFVRELGRFLERHPQAAR